MGSEFNSVVGSQNMAYAAVTYGAIPTPTANTPAASIPSAVDFNALRTALGSSDGANVLPLNHLFSPDGHVTQFGVNFLTQRANLSGITIATTAHDLGALTLTENAPEIQRNIVDIAKITEYAAAHGGNYLTLSLSSVEGFQGGGVISHDAAVGYFNDATGLVVGACKENASCTQITSYATAHEQAVSATLQHELAGAQQAYDRFASQVGTHVNATSGNNVCTAAATRENSDACARAVGDVVTARNTARTDLGNERLVGARVDERPSLATQVHEATRWHAGDYVRAGVEIGGLALLAASLYVGSKRKNAAGAVYDARLNPYKDNLENRIQKKLNRLSEKKNDDGENLHKINVKNDTKLLTTLLMAAWNGVAAHPQDGLAACQALDACIPGTSSKFTSDGVVSEEGLKALLTIVSQNPAYDYGSAQEHAGLILALFDESAPASKPERKVALARRVILPDTTHLTNLLKTLCPEHEVNAQNDANDLISQLRANQLTIPSGATSQLTREQLKTILDQAKQEMGVDFSSPWSDYLAALEKKPDEKKDNKQPDPTPPESEEDKTKKAIKGHIEAAFNELSGTPEIGTLTLDEIVKALFEFNESTAKLDLTKLSALTEAFINDTAVNAEMAAAIRAIRKKITQLAMASRRTVAILPR